MTSHVTPPATPPPAATGLDAWGWDPAWAARFAEHAPAGLVPARVILEQRGRYLVHDGTRERPATVSGRLRHRLVGLAGFPAVGDWVALEPVHGPADPWVVQAVLPRRSQVSRRASVELVDERVLAANVETLFIVQALTGDLNPRRLERYLAMTWASGAQPVVVLNKADRCADLPAALARLAPVTPGVPVHVASAIEGRGLDEVRAHLRPGITVAFLGSSGVGKSTLINRLLGGDQQRTAAVREDDQRGRHTTTERQLLPAPGGALLLDTPGLRSLELWGAREGLEATFAELEDLAAECHFSDCRHDGEPGCAVQAAIARGELAPERLASQRKLERELEALARRATPQGRAAARRFSRLVRDASDAAMARKGMRGWRET